MTRLDLHKLAEERSLAYHREVAKLLRDDPSLLARARVRLDQWIAENGRSAHYARRWREKLEAPLAELLEQLVDPSQDARAMRQATPFAGFVEPRQRWRIWREVRERLEAPDR